MKNGVIAIGLLAAAAGIWIWNSERQLPGSPVSTTPSPAASRALEKAPAAAEPPALNVPRSADTVVVPRPAQPPSLATIPPPARVIEPTRTAAGTELDAVPIPDTGLVPTPSIDPAPLAPPDEIPRHTPEAAVPEAPTSSAVAAPSAPSPDAGSSPPAEIAAIQQVLARYKRMFDELDASEATAIWPGVDSRALTRMFSRLDRQTLEFDGCVFAVWETGAAADCTGWLSYVPRFGNATLRREPHSWTIELERANDGWQIVRVNAR